MAVSQQQQVEDEFGYQRFALTEIAYDLINSLIGVYARLRSVERQKPMPDLDLIEKWQCRIQELQTIYHRGDWSSLTSLNEVIAELTIEYKTHHTEFPSTSVDATDRRPKEVHTPRERATGNF